MGKMSQSFVEHPEVSVLVLLLLMKIMFVFGRCVPSPGQPSKVRPKELLAHKIVSSVYQ